jgi:hypothetical protein
MIYKPQNVYPHNNTIDASLQNTFTFQFNGSNVICWDYIFYNANNNKVVRRSYKPISSSNIYNQDAASTPIRANTFENGYNYKYKMNIYQEKFDIFVMQGTVRDITETVLSDNQIPITYGIDTIKEPVYYDIKGVSTLIGACYIEIDNGEITEKRMITKYDPNIKYGADDGYGNYDYRSYIEINVPFSVKPSAGTTYRIYCNYVTSPEYYFQCRKTPVINPVVKLNSWGNIECSSDYYQEEGVNVKCYQYSLYKKEYAYTILEGTIADYENNDSLEEYTTLNSFPIVPSTDTDWNKVVIGNNNYITVSYTSEDTQIISDTKRIDHYDFENNIVYLQDNLSRIPSVGASIIIFQGRETLVRQSDNIYNQRLTYSFNDIVRNIDFRVALKVTTQDNMEVENSVNDIFNSVSSFVEGDNVSCSADYEKNCVNVKYSLNRKVVVLMSREDVNTGESDRFVSGTFPSLDYLTASNKTYRYHIVPIIKDGDDFKYGDEYITNTISPEWCYWTIASLKQVDEAEPFEPNKELFRISDYWKLHIDAQESEITQNTNSVIHVGYSSKPKITMGVNNYITGSITCKLSQLEPSSGTITDNIYMVEDWRNFITQNSLFLLKNPKGDIFVVGISASPTTSYEYKYKQKTTTVSFSFTECRNIKDIVIL